MPAARTRRRRQSLRSPVRFWSVAIVTAGAAAVFVGGLAGRAADAERAWGRQQRVTVALVDLPRGHVVEASDVATRSWPVAVVPAGADSAAPIGQVVVDPVFRGEAITAARLAPAGLSRVAALLPRGSRAVAIAGGPATVPLAVGDHVDVLATDSGVDGDGPAGPARAVARDAVVVAVDQQAVTVAVPAGDVAAVAAAASSGRAVVVLRAG